MKINSDNLSITELEIIEKEMESFLNNDSENVDKGVIQKIAAQAYIDYAASTILGRAVPNIYDGLKPVHRRILQTMKDLSLTPGGQAKKSAKIVGNALGSYHPHGDNSVYDAVVGLVQPWNKMLPLVNGQGNFGSIDGDSPAAQRYTEAKFTKSGYLFFQDIDKSVVNYVPNYDNTEEEPELLPVPFPNLLINGGFGIAAGMASKIPPHNPNEILDAVTFMLKQRKKGKETTSDDLLPIILAPDFPTKGIVYETQSMKSIIETGKGKVRIRAKHHVEKVGKTKFAIIVTEIPYQINKSKLIEEIVELAKEKQLTTLNIIRDESSKEGIRIYIELKPGVDAELTWNFLVKNTNLDISFNYNMVVIKDYEPVEASILDALNSFIDFRTNVQLRKYTHIKNESANRQEIVLGLLIALENIDKVISIIRTSKTEEEATENLKKELSTTDRQTKAILDMRIQRLIGMEKLKLEKENQELEETISYANKVIESDDEKINIILEETKKVKKELGLERQSIIQNELSGVDMEDLIPKEDCIVYVTQKGYLRRESVSAINKQNRGTKGSRKIDMQEDDYLIQTFNTHSHSILLFITTKGKVYASKAYKIPDIARGRYVANIFELDQNDKVVKIVEAESFDKETNLLMVTEKGFIKQTALSEFTGAVRASGVIGINLSEEDIVTHAAVIKDKETDVLLINNEGNIIRFDVNEVPVVGRNTRGVIGMRLKDNQRIIGGDISKNDESCLITIGEKGTIKASNLAEYRKQKRAGMGVSAMKTTSKTGDLIKAIILEDLTSKDLILNSKKGMTNKISLEEIKTQARKTSGVQAMKMNSDDVIVDGFAIDKFTEENEENTIEETENE